MGWLEKFKRLLYRKKLRFDAKAVSSAERKMLNIKNAQKIGILFNATRAEDIISITSFAEKLKQSGKQTSILGFQHTKKKELTNPQFINNLDVNWFYIPESEKITEFHKKEFDILIGAFVNECLPLEYIAATSKAKFRVGTFSDETAAHFELMINTNKNQSLDYLLQQIDHFLNLINP